MSWKLKKTVALVGMMGAGKTAVGKALAAKLGVAFLDSDAEIEAAANMTVAEIFARDGEPFFREKESQVIQRLLETESCILSTGGGAYMAQGNRQMISDKGVAVWLNADLDLLWQRVRHKDTRPLLRAPNPLGVLTELFNKRVPIYGLADLQIHVKPGCSIDETALMVLDVLQTRPDVLEKVE
ncbi:shikimate kinase [Thalassovita sp.]|jgi:shikimate kinase|uniref:shikimate kinase n=1 Tax=Thalassovita sp. TaxID=1979401 RepID=UPI003B5BE4FC